MFIMHPVLGYITSLILILILLLVLYFLKSLGNQDELLGQEENEINIFYTETLRNEEILSVYALGSKFKENWFRNKKVLY